MNSIPIPQLTSIVNFPQFKKIKEPDTKIPRINVNGVANINSRASDTGIEVKINDKLFRLHYPPSIWQRFPKTHRKILAQNIAFSTTFHLPYLYTSLKRLFYNIPVPLSEAFLFKGMSLSLPSTAIMQTQKHKRITSDLLRRLYEVDYVFSNKKTDIPPYNRTSFSDYVIMPFTFGKDSLLTFALAKDLGLTVFPVYISEPHLPYEEATKKLLSVPFKKEFKVKIAFLRNSLGLLREPYGWFGWEMQLTQYSLMLLPYVYAKRAGYILFSNEQSCNETVIDEDGFRYNPVYEQSHSWLLQNSLMTSIIGGNSLSIGTILEPLHDLAIMKILHQRYPKIAKYQSSCDLEEKPKTDSRWCENCSKCARIYIYLLAHGVNPKTVGFMHNLLRDKYHHLFTVFASEHVRRFGYDQSEVGNDEQLLAFLMAYQKGYRGPVMTSFIRHYLAQTRKREKSLKQIYFGVHSAKTVPSNIRSRLLQIYRNELKEMA
ncbi:MAG: hypothetical protein AAB874_03820 [Patescibacteria group bacterium]